MAKIKKGDVTTESMTFNQLNDELSKISPDGDIMNECAYAKIDEWIPTGFYILNAAISGSLFGGMPNRRSLMFAGLESCLQKDETVEIYILKNKNISQHHDTKS